MKLLSTKFTELTTANLSLEVLLHETRQIEKMDNNSAQDFVIKSKMDLLLLPDVMMPLIRHQ